MAVNSPPKWFLLFATGVISLSALALLRKPAAGSFFNQGLEAKREWRLEEAIRDFHWATRLNSDFIEARLEKAICHQLRGDFISAGQELAVLKSDRIEDRALRGQLLNTVGVNHFNSSEPDAAREAHEQSLKLAKEIGDRRLEAQALIDLSRVLYHLKGLSDEALERLEQAVQIGRDLGDPLIEAGALRNIGVVRWWHKGERDRALTEYYEPALELYRRQNDLRSAAIMLSNISLVHFERGDLFRLLKYQDESLKIKYRVGDLAGLSDSYLALGQMYYGLENYRKAHEFFSRSLDLSRRIGYRLTQYEVENLLALTRMRLGEFDGAIDLLRGLLDRERGTPLLAKYRAFWLARCHLMKGEPEMALQYAERSRALELGTPEARAGISQLALMGSIHTVMGDRGKASALLAQAEERFSLLQETWWFGKIDLLLALADLASAEGRLTHALNELLEAAEIESRILASSGTQLAQGQDRRIYDRLFALLLEPARPSATGSRPEDKLAFGMLEQLRYRSFKHLIVKLAGRPDSHGPQREETQAARQIERVSARLKRRDSPVLREQLRRAYGHYEELVLEAQLAGSEYQLVREAQPAQPSTVQNALDSQTALVAYLFAGDKVYALAITQSEICSVALPVSRPNLAAKVKLFRSLIFGGNGVSDKEQPGANWQPVAVDLRRVLIEPLEQSRALAGIRRIGLIPFGFLHDLPFAALARIEEERARFLVEDYALFYTPSATFLASARALPHSSAPPPRDRAFISFGRSEPDEEGLPPLGFAVEEARAVARVFGGEARLNAEASETELKRLASRFRVIHLATHAVSEPQMPLLSRLKLQATREDDGNLSVREILDLGLRADLVTLGACQSGQSYSSSGSELGELDRIGLIEAFLHAGARSVLATLLPINDRPTAGFMKAFYKNLLSKDKADALADAQKAMLRGEIFYPENGEPRRLTHPRYWAPFILVGDYHPVEASPLATESQRHKEKHREKR